MSAVRVVLPSPLRALARCGPEVTLPVATPLGTPASLHDVIDAIERAYPMLRGTIRDRQSRARRAFVRFYAESRDLSHSDLAAPLPEAITAGTEPLLIIAAMAGG